MPIIPFEELAGSEGVDEPANTGNLFKALGMSIGVVLRRSSVATAVIGGVAIGGGVGRILGVILGVLLLSIITTGMNIAGLSEFIQQMLTGAVLIAAVLVDTFRGRGDRKRGLTRALKTLVGRPASAAPSTADKEHQPTETTTQQ